MDVVGLIAAFVSGFIIAWSIKPDKSLRRGLKPEVDTTPEIAVNRQRRAVKEERKSQIITTIDNSGKITAREVQEMFAVSNATATRYLQELKKESRIQERGKGRAVHYTLND